jgi:hypothetical protein
MLLPPLLLSLVLVARTDPPGDNLRKPSAIAPSLPALTLGEENKLDGLIDRFIQADTGKLKGADGQKAMRDFDALGQEAIPALIRGLNKAAGIEHSCPTLVIGRKLSRMLLASKDVELLEFARDNIGAGVGRSSHAGSLNDLRLQCMLRRNSLIRLGVAATGPRPVKGLTTVELTRAASTEKGPRLKQVLNELETRRGPEVLTTLLGATRESDRELRSYALDLVDRHLTRQTVDVVRQKLADDDAEIRKAGIRAGVRKPALVGDVIDRLDDAQTEVREEAHAALVKLARGQDFGPRADAEAGDRRIAQQRWRTWWERQKQ